MDKYKSVLGRDQAFGPNIAHPWLIVLRSTYFSTLQEDASKFHVAWLSMLPLRATAVPQHRF
jgi:hypothetical protein